MKEQEEWRAVLVCVAAKNQRCSEETVFTALNNYLQIGNRTGILMSNGETVLQPSEGCTAREIWTGSILRLEYVWQVVSQLISDSILL